MAEKDDDLEMRLERAIHIANTSMDLADRYKKALEKIASGKVMGEANPHVYASGFDEPMTIEQAIKIAKEALPKGQPVPRYKIGGHYEPED